MAIRFDLNTLVPGGVTLHELISNAGVPGVADFPIGLAFGGNCLAVTATRIGNSPEFGYIYYLTNLPNTYIVVIPGTRPTLFALPVARNRTQLQTEGERLLQICCRCSNR